MVIVTLANEKGGIGKTTLACHIAWFIAETGRRVLAVDLDPQGNLSYTLLGEKGLGIKRAVMQEWPLDRAATAVEGYSGFLWVLTSDKATGDVRNWLKVSGSRLDALDPLIDQAREAGFDYVVVDTPPSPAMDNESGRVLDALLAPALHVSDFVLVPTEMEQLALGGLAALSATLTVLQKGGAKVQLLGVVPTKYDARTTEHAANLREVVAVYNNLVYPVIRKAIDVARSPAYGLPVWAFAPNNPVSGKLRAVAERVVRDVE